MNCSGKPEFQYARIDGDKQIICDGFELAVLSEADRLPLPPMPENVTPYFKYEGVIPTTRTAELTLPDIGKLKSAIKIKKSEITNVSKSDPRTVYYDFGARLPLVNAEYLLNVLECLGECTAFATDADKKQIVLENQNGSIGIVLPVKRMYGEEGELSDGMKNRLVNQYT